MPVDPKDMPHPGASQQVPPTLQSFQWGPFHPTSPPHQPGCCLRTEGTSSSQPCHSPPTLSQPGERWWREKPGVPKSEGHRKDVQHRTDRIKGTSQRREQSQREKGKGEIRTERVLRELGKSDYKLSIRWYEEITVNFARCKNGTVTILKIKFTMSEEM